MLLSIRRNIVLKGNSSLAFTVIELLTSIFIVALLVTILSVVFNIGIRAYKQADDIVDITNRAQRFLRQISSELAGAVVSEDPGIPFVGEETSIYFMAPWENSSEIELCEFGYNLVGTIIRRHFVTGGAGAGFEYPNDAVDYTTGGEQYFVDLGENGSVTFNYMNDGSSSESWPSSDTDLPQIVEIQVSMQDSREVTYAFTTRVFLPGSTNNP